MKKVERSVITKATKSAASAEQIIVLLYDLQIGPAAFSGRRLSLACGFVRVSALSLKFPVSKPAFQEVPC